jgi:hypothetical protein
MAPTFGLWNFPLVAWNSSTLVAAASLGPWGEAGAGEVGREGSRKEFGWLGHGGGRTGVGSGVG